MATATQRAEQQGTRGAGAEGGRCTTRGIGALDGVCGASTPLGLLLQRQPHRRWPAIVDICTDALDVKRPFHHPPPFRLEPVPHLWRISNRLSTSRGLASAGCRFWPLTSTFA